MKSPKVIFFDLDDTLITTVSGKTFPQGIWDMKPKFEVWDKIKDIMPDCVFIVTNQGGIGRFVSEKEFETKLDYITLCLKQYIKSNNLVFVDSMYCPSIEKDDPYRKPNPGMLTHLCGAYDILSAYNKNDIIMVGDASGLPGNFSDTDKLTADNFGIKYIDVNDFIQINFT